jgi:tetratricopeptide (TPR) repeat protein
MTPSHITTLATVLLLLSGCTTEAPTSPRSQSQEVVKRSVQAPVSSPAEPTTQGVVASPTVLIPTPISPDSKKSAVEFTDSFLPVGAIDLTAIEPDQDDHDSMDGGCEHPMPPSDLLTTEWFPHNDSAFRDHFSEAVALLDEDRREDAVEALRMELFDAPDSGNTWLLLGETYAALGRKEKALDSVSEALVVEPQLEGALAFLARFHLEQGQAVAAREAAESLVALRPTDAEASHLLARSQMGLAMWSEAIATCQRTIEIDEEFVRAYNNLSFAALQIGKNELARDTLVEAAELPGIEAYMLNNLGLAYERTGDSAEAIRTFAKAISIQPSYSRASLNRDRVQKQVDEEVAAELARILQDRDRDTETTLLEAAASVVPTSGVDGAPSEEAIATP